MKSKILLALFAVLAINLPALAADTDKSAPAAKIAILEPKDGATVPTTFKVKFGATGVNIVPAGTDQENSGHHHLLIDTDKLPDLHGPLPATANLLHFGKGQTETEVTLAPGKHTLQLILGNYAHIPGATPVISKKITVTVK